MSVDIGRLMGSLVGQSQANMRRTLHMLDAMSADVSGIYQRLGDSGSKPGRKIRRDPSQN